MYLLKDLRPLETKFKIKANKLNKIIKDNKILRNHNKKVYK